MTVLSGPTRRGLLQAFGAAMLQAPALRSSQSTQAVRLDVDPRRKLNRVPVSFMGLGYEISSVAEIGLLSARNATYVRLVRTLGSKGVIRIGGNTSDDSSFSAEGRSVSAPKGTVVNRANLRDLGTFLDATGWDLIWGLNLGASNEQQILEEAQAVYQTAGKNLLAFEIGNEPDLFGKKAAHRPEGYNYDDYLRDYRHYKASIRRRLPDAPFAGPDVASATDWVTRFAADEGSDLKLLTHHYYRECANANSTLDKLLHPDPKLAPELERLRAAAATANVPYRICETNSFCGGGKPGVSDTFGAALWVLDFMFAHAMAGCAGLNMETGVNQLGFLSSYSPIGRDAVGKDVAKPEYYGMLAFAQASRGFLVPVDVDQHGLNLTAYAVVADDGRLSITVVNKDATQHADIRILASGERSTLQVLNLRAPSISSQEGIALGGTSVSSSGTWDPVTPQSMVRKGGTCEVHVPAASAAILHWK